MARTVQPASVNRIVDPHDLYKKETFEYMKGSLLIPSTFHSYSIACDYVRQWFLSKFRDTEFTKVHINDNNVYKDYRDFSIKKAFLESTPPLLAITPNMSFQYNRNFLDTNPYGIDQLIRAGNIENTVIKDTEIGYYLGVDFEELEIKFSFAIKLESRAQQIDMYRYITMAFPFGHSYGDVMSMDYHIPYLAMLQFVKNRNKYAAYDLITEDGKIKDIYNFLSEVNSKSTVPVVYKHRSINGRPEFFFRDTNTHMRMNLYDVPDLDSGENRGMLKTNYRIDFDLTMYIPSPKFYIQYISNKQDHVLGIEGIKRVNSLMEKEMEEKHVPIYSIELHKIPNMNSKKWNMLLQTDYIDDVYEDVVIDVSEIMGAYNKLIESYIFTGVNPDEYIEFRLYNGDNYNIKHHMDWKERNLYIDETLETTTTKIVIYMDTVTMNRDLKELGDLEEYGNSRILSNTNK